MNQLCFSRKKFWVTSLLALAVVILAAGLFFWKTPSFSASTLSTDAITGTLSSAQFDPMSNQTITLNYTVKQDTQVKIYIADSKGSLVKKVYASGGKKLVKPGAYTATWNGTNDKRKVLPVGDYNVYFVAVTFDTHDVKPITIYDSSLQPAISIKSVSPSSFNTALGEQTTITYQVPKISDYKISIKDLNNNTINVIAAKTGLSIGDYMENWDGKDGQGQSVAAGVYSVIIEENIAMPTLSPAKASITVTDTVVSTVNSVDTIISDMTLVHEAYPHGVPDSWSWFKAPLIQNAVPTAGYNAPNAWGQVYVDRSTPDTQPAPTPPNTLVELRNIQSWYLSKSDNQWHKVQSSTKVDGKAFYENFLNDIEYNINWWNSANGYTTAIAGYSLVDPTKGTWAGVNFHFWPLNSNQTFDPLDVAAGFSTFQARLILKDESGADDRDQAKYVASAGMDYWKDGQMQWLDGGLGRFKYVTKEWQAFNYLSMFDYEAHPATTELINQFRANHPTLE